MQVNPQEVSAEEAATATEQLLRPANGKARRFLVKRSDLHLLGDLEQGIDCVCLVPVDDHDHLLKELFAGQRRYRAMLAILSNSFPLLDDNGLDEAEHHCEWHIQQERIGGAELGDIDIKPDMKALCALQQSLVTGEDDVYVELIDKAQYQRITAAMAAEVERLKAEVERLHRVADQAWAKADQFGNEMFWSRWDQAKHGGFKAVLAERDALRAELAEVKGREAVGEVQLRTGGGISLLHVDLTQPLPPGTKLYTSPPASPDVEGLVKALEADFPLLDDNGLDETLHHCEWHIQQERKRLHAILDGASADQQQGGAV